MIDPVRESPLRAQHRRLCQYVRNTGQSPLRIADFDDDWEPAGAMYREGLVADGLIAESEGGMVLTEAGLALTAEPGSAEALAAFRGETA